MSNEESIFWRDRLFEDTPWRKPTPIRAKHRITGEIKEFKDYPEFVNHNMYVQFITGVPNIWTTEFKDKIDD